MPGLLRGVARTAVIAGTATAVSGRVQRRQADRFADRDAQTAVRRDQAYESQAYQEQGYPEQGYQQPAPAPVPEQRAAPAQDDMLDQLKKLGELKSSGVLTEEEFATQKARILGG